MIDFNKVCKTYPSKNGPVAALDNITCHVNPGEIFGIIGKSGAGKSTLIRLANRLEMPTSGTVTVAGQALTSLNEKALRQARRQIAMIFQHFNLLSAKTVYANIAFPLQLIGTQKPLIDKKVKHLLSLVGLEQKAQQYPAGLSGGQKQRVAIARALACDPKVLLCDEATSALDPKTTESILELLQNINRQLGLTILLITHEMDVIKTICHRVAVLDHGKIIEQADTLSLFAHPKTAIVKNLTRKSLRQQLPHTLAEQLQPQASEHTYPLVQIFFFGEAASQPIISHLIQKIGINVNILQANLEYIQHEPVGSLLVQFIAEESKITAARRYLSNIGLASEVLGYVDSTAH